MTQHPDDRGAGPAGRAGPADHRHVSARAAADRRRPVGVVVGGAADVDRHAGRAGAGPVDRRSAVGFAGPAQTADRGNRAAHARLGDVPGRAEHRCARHRARRCRASARRRRWWWHRGRRRSVRGLRRGDGDVAADAGAGRGAGAGARRSGAAVLLHASWHWVFAVLVVLAGALLVVAVLALPETLPPDHRRPLRVRGSPRRTSNCCATRRFVILVLVAALGMSGLFAYIAGASFVLQGRYGLDQQAFALVFGAGAIALIGATQFNVRAAATVLAAAASWCGRWSRRRWSRGWCSSALAAAHVGGLSVSSAGLGDPGRDGSGDPERACGRTVPPSRCRGHRGGTAGCRPVRARRGGRPVVGVLGNDEVAMAVVMSAGVVIALIALVLTGVHRSAATDAVAGGAVAEPA